MAASTDAASAVEALDRLVRVVRADADGRHQLAVRAAFVGALARSHPEVVREPGGKRAWTPAALSALAAATTALLESKHELHCVVGVDDFAVNVSYAKKSLVYVRAELAPALRVLTYASLPPPASGESNRESNADEGKRPTTARDATTVQAGAPAALDARASEALRAAARAALDDDVESDSAERSESQKNSDSVEDSSSKASKERRAARDAGRLRVSLQRAFPGAHWHVAHDWSSNPLGFAPAASSTHAVSLEKGNFAFLAWRHAARRPRALEALGMAVADRATLTFARRSFLLISLACAMWFNNTCVGVEPSLERVRRRETQRREEDPLTAALCAAAPRAAPFALVALTLMGGNYAMGLARRVAAHAAGRQSARKRKAA